VRRGYYIHQLLQTIDAYGLEDRYPKEISPIVLMAQNGMLSDAMAKAQFQKIQPLLDEIEDYPNFLHRPPTEEQLNEEGKPDIEIGNLIEGKQQRFGIRLRRGSVPCILAAGTRGGGKSNLIRAIIHQVEALNVQED
jgi:chromosomal replication initiation ATPase DnaA